MIVFKSNIQDRKKTSKTVKMTKIITNFICFLYIYLYFLNSFINIIVLINYNMCSEMVRFFKIDTDEDLGIFLISNTGSYFLCMKTCSMINYDNSIRFKESSYVNMKKEKFEISYPKEIFLEFEFLEEKIHEKKNKVEIYIKENDFYRFLSFIKHLKSQDTIIKIEPEVFFEILKYLNILKVKRDKNYKAFIKALVYNSIMFDKDYFLKKVSNLSLFHQQYNNLHIIEVIRCISRFYLMAKHFLYETFDEYIPLEFSSQIFLHEKYKKDKNFTSMQFINSNLKLYFFRYLMRLKFREIWIIMMRILYIRKLKIDFALSRVKIDMNIIVSTLPKNVEKISLKIRDEMINIFNLLLNHIDLSLVKKLVLSITLFSKHIFEMMKYFKNLEELTLGIYEITLNEIIELENSESLKSIKCIKVFFRDTIDLNSKLNRISLVGRENNICIYLLDEIRTDNDSYSKLEVFLSHNFYNYITGVNLLLGKSNFNCMDFSRIFHSDKIKCLKIDTENVNGNKLKNYDFLNVFKNLKYLYFTNIEITNKLLIAILRHNQLISVVFDFFAINPKLNSEIVDFVNKSVIYMEFYNLSNYIGNSFLGFIMKFKVLKHLIFNLYIFEYTGYVNSIFKNEFYDFETLRPAQSIDLPKLESLVYRNKFDCPYQAKFSVLHVLSFFFNLEMLGTLVYDIGFLDSNDVYVFENFKILDSLKLSIQRNDLNTNTLKKILTSNIKKTISNLKIESDKYSYVEIISIYKFQKLKFLKIGAINIYDKDIKYYDLLVSMDLILCEKYILKRLDDLNFPYSKNIF